MDLTTVYWIICMALGVAICVMAAGLVTIVLDIVLKVQQIRGYNARN